MEAFADNVNHVHIQSVISDVSEKNYNSCKGAVKTN